jgi:parallel beta-helix repeat protein
MADIFVATTGNDSNNTGTIDRPFASISRAIEEADPGETIQVRGGTYYPSRGIWIGEKDSGTAGAPITIRGYNNERPVIDGSSISGNSPIFNINANYLNIEGFDLQYSPQAGITVWGADNVNIKDNIVHHSKDTGIFVGHDWASNRPKNVIVEDNTVYKSSLKNSARNSSSGWGLGIAGFGSNMTIANNKVFENYGEGIGVSGKGNKVTNNTSYNNFSAEIYVVNAEGAVVEKNLAYHTGESDFLRNINGQWQPSAGIAIAKEYSTNEVLNSNLDNNTIRNNVVVGGSTGLYYGNYEAGGGLKNTEIVNNTFSRGTNEVLHIDPDGHSNTTIANNIFNQSNGKQISYVPSQSGLRFENNVLYNGSSEIKPTSLSAGDADEIIQADPKFLNKGGFRAEDYQLQGGSSAINAGTALSAPSKDYFDRTRPLGGVIDVGALEYTGSTSSNTTSNSVAPVSVSNNTGGNTNNSGTAGNDWLRGTNGNDSVDGKEGNDTIRSFEGNDNLIGGKDNDTLRGGVGDDTLSGGSGKDLMAGDDGNDRFVFDTNKAFNLSNRANVDVIQNFSLYKDKIVLDKTTFVGLNNSGEFAVVTGNSAAATNAAKITYDRSSGGLFFNPNGTTSGFGDGGQIATITNAPALTASNILVQA